MKSCKEYIELISECIDGEISDADRSELEIHLEFCPECKKVAEAFAAISGSFPREETVPENFTAGTMAKIKAEATRPTGFKKFISGYGKYTGLAAALVVVLLGARVFNGGAAKETAADTAAYMNSTGSAPMATVDAVRGEAEMESDFDYITGNTAADYVEDAEECAPADGNAAPTEAAGGSVTSDNSEPQVPGAAPTPMPEAGEDYSEPQFSVTVQVTDVNELYNKMGYKERFYSVSRLYSPASEELIKLLESGESTQIFRSLDETHYKVPMAQLNELDPEVFTEIVFDDLTAEYGLVILMTENE